MRKILLLTLRSCKLHVGVAIWILLPVVNGQSVSVIGKAEDYKTIFGPKYSEALTYLHDNPWIADSLKSNHIDPEFAVAIVFPELIRYSALRDKFESGALFTLYVQYGQKYADFSVGRFQMKPTFVNQLESDMQRLFINNSINPLKFDLTDSEKARLDRVKRLDSPLGQVKYLIYFVKVMDSLYEPRTWSSQTEKLKFYATAYNCGYTLTEAIIEERINRKTFYTTISKSAPYYCYAEIARDFFERIHQQGANTLVKY
jgi:hypothetical protein